MLLADILHLLLDEVEHLNYTNQEFYELLFLRTDIPTELDLEDTVKKIFSNSKGRRTLPGEVTKQFRSRKGFFDFCLWIEKNYISKINYKNKHLYNELCMQIQECSYLPENYKKKLLSSFDPNNSSHMARLIASCILLGNYNTRQTKLKSPFIKENYKLSLDFIGISDCCYVQSYPMTDKIWDASLRSFQFSREEGNRFYSLDIIKRLLPKGYLTDSILNLRGETADGVISSIIELCTKDTFDMVVIGEGGIGKTTFLQQLLTECFLDTSSDKEKYYPYRQGIQIPIFIELNRCPVTIGSWYDPTYGKTNFITRYIAQMLENHSSLAAVKPENLMLLEKEFQKTPLNGVPEYLLLLDGFNEVSTESSSRGKSVRSYLSDEISVLHSYPNIRIITTSRETQSAAFMQKFQTIRLLGLEDPDIIEYLKECGMSDTSIGITMANKQLVTCLRVPLFLCMFASEYGEMELLPETSGEILYCFFHRNSSFYNARQRSDDTRTNPLTTIETAVILDFTLPYIGWNFEDKETFSLSAVEFEKYILDSFRVLDDLFLNSNAIPFEDFRSEKKVLTEAVQTLYLEDGSLRITDIIACIHSYLGILYHYSDTFADTGGQSRYAFIHHHFRDYFSAIFDIQLLRMLPYITPSVFWGKDSIFPIGSYDYYLNQNYWQSHKVSFISQILMEHRNRPVINENSRNWTLPVPDFVEQCVLTKALDFCRVLTADREDIHYLLQNILSAIVCEREELSGMNLSWLDFRHCNLFNIPCSKKGATKNLTANFNGSSLYADCFEATGHLDDVIEYVYYKNNCYSLDQAGTIKCWDVRSGKQEYALHSEFPEGLHDFSSRGFMQISNDGHWLAVKVQPEIPTEEGAHAALFDLTSMKDKPIRLIPPQKGQVLTSLSFTGDMQHLLLLIDRHYLCCFHIPDGSLKYAEMVADFMNHTDLYTKDSESPVYAFTSEYNEFEFDVDASYLSDENEGDDDQFDMDDEWEESGSKMEIPCILYKWYPTSKRIEELYSFVSTPGTLPAASYFHSTNCFLLYNYTNKCLEKFDCDFLLAEPVWENITWRNGNPAFILPSTDSPNECYLMYPDVCYEMDLSSEQEDGIIMAYSVGPMNKLLTEYELEIEDGLRIQTETVPSGNRILVRSDRTVYEWNTSMDSLTPRYNSVYYGCTGLIADPSHNRSILVHQYNGVSIFENYDKRLTVAYCFPFIDYYVEDCAYHEETQHLALRFCRPGHEFIKVMDLSDSSNRVIFSAMKNDFTESMNFNPDGSYLLICTLDSCMEYEFQTNRSYILTEHQAGSNESFVGADYMGDEIQIAVVSRQSGCEKSVRPRCDYYRRIRKKDSCSYQRKWGYYIPTLSPELAEAFVHQNHDMGVGGGYGEDGIQSYWVTRGFFMEENTAIDRFLTVECFEYKKEIRKKIPAKKLNLFQFLYVRHDFSIDNPRRVGGTNYCYSYLSDDFSQAVCIRDYEELYLWEDMKNESEHPHFFDYRGETDEYTHAYWDYAIPSGDDRLLCCYENYRLIQVNARNGRIYDEVHYTPGIAICGCKFKNIIADEDTKDLIRDNGGLVM